MKVLLLWWQFFLRALRWMHTILAVGEAKVDPQQKYLLHLIDSYVGSGQEKLIMVGD